jgi:hypothetical protein
MPIAVCFTSAAVFLMSCLLSSAASAQHGDTWAHAFSMADPGMPMSAHTGACYGRGKQPDSLYLTPAPVGNVEAWGGEQRGWRTLSGTWFVDTSEVALVALHCLGDEKQPHHVIVERDGHVLRVNVLSLPAQPADVIRVRAKSGELVQLLAAELPNGDTALLSRDSLAAARAAATRVQKAADRRIAAREQAARRKQLRAKGWSSDIIEAVLRGAVRIGMTTAMVREAWGEPDHVNSTLTERGRSEQWVYSVGQYVYVENGLVTAVQTSR